MLPEFRDIAPAMVVIGLGIFGVGMLAFAYGPRFVRFLSHPRSNNKPK